MKKHYQPAKFLIVFYALLALFGNMISDSSHMRHHHRPPVVKNQNDGDAGHDLAEMQDFISESEYRIVRSHPAGDLQCPNRAQQLRAFIEPGAFTIHHRLDSAGSGASLRITTAGIFANNHLLFRPDDHAETELKANSIQIKYQHFTEEFVNDQNGLRQNFIIHQAPKGVSELSVRLYAEGMNVVDEKNDGLRFKECTPNESATEWTYNELKCWDANGNVLVAKLSANFNQIDIAVDVADAIFPITIDPIIKNGTPQNADKALEINQTSAWFGYSVSTAGDINGDGYSEVVIGAPKYDNGQLDEGAAFVFPGTANGVSSAGVILQSDQANAQAGTSVATAGDVNNDGYSDILVGAPYYDNGQTDEGAVFLYLGSAAGIVTTPYSLLEVDQANASFGVSVAMAGDVNGDGYSDILAGAHRYDNGQLDEGAAFLYYGSPAGPVNRVPLECDQAGAMMGFSVSSAGDVNGDGFSDIMSGARLYSGGQLYEGAVFVYHGSAGGVVTTNPLRLENNQVDTRLGHSVSFAGDINGDGYGDVVLGAYLYDRLKANCGAVFLHYGSATGLNPTAGSVLYGTQTEEQFGFSVSSAGDVNGDGFADLAVGSRFRDNGHVNEGAAFVYLGGRFGLNTQASSTLESNHYEAWMGSSVAPAGDVNGDGFSDLVVGAYAYDNGQMDEGLAMIYHGKPDGLTESHVSFIPGERVAGRMGRAATGIGDANGDGLDDFIVGLAGDNFPMFGYTREAHVFYGAAGGVVNNDRVQLSLYDRDMELGSVMSAAGDVNGDGFDDAVLTAYGTEEADRRETVIVYYGGSGGLSPSSVTELTATPDEMGYGVSLAGAGDINGDGYADIVVGVTGYVVNDSTSGAAFVYFGSQTGISTTPQIISSPGGTTAFGKKVSMAGDVNRDGFDDVVILSDDKVFVFNGSSGGLVATPAVSFAPDSQIAEFVPDADGLGDVNGDGYADIVLTGRTVADMTVAEQRSVFVLYGSGSGVSMSNMTTIKHSSPAKMAISGAGDVDGDGYSDLIVGDQSYDTFPAQAYSGAIFIYHGSSLGIIAPYSFLYYGSPDVNLGTGVGSVGDVNGDGYSDVYGGAPSYSNGSFQGQGAAYVFYGNTKNSFLRNNLLMYNADLTTLYSRNYPGQATEPDFGVGLYAKSYLGTGKGKLVWESKGLNEAFSRVGAYPITTSTQFTGSQTTFTSLGTAGLELKNLIAKQSPVTRVRVRVRFHPVLALTGQMFGPWRYMSDYVEGTSIAPPPQQARLGEGKQVLVFKKEQSLFYPNPATDRLFLSPDIRKPVSRLQLLNAAGQIVSETTSPSRGLDVGNTPGGMHLLTITYQDGNSETARVLIRK